MANHINALELELDAYQVSKSYKLPLGECITKIPKSQRSLSILQLNIRSLNKNFDSFIAFLHLLKIDCDIIVLTECWLKSAVIPNMNGYNVHFTKNTTNQNDGVVMYIRSSLHYIVSEPDITDANCLLCKMDNNVAIVALYRSPSFIHVDNFLNSLDSILKPLTKFKHVALVGDINIDIKPNNNDRHSYEYLTFTASHGLLPAHLYPTRLNNCLDHILLKTNQPGTSIVIDSLITDHLPIFLSINLDIPKPNPTYTAKVVDISNIQKDIESTDFSPILFSNDANDAAYTLTTLLTQIIEKHTRFSKVSRKNRNIKPWITPGLLRCIRNRDKMHLALKTQPDNPILKITYSRYRNFCNSLLRKLKINYEKTEFMKRKNNPKATWDLIKTVTHSKSAPPPLKELQLLEPDKLASANSVNNYFVNVGKDLATNIRQCVKIPVHPPRLASTCNSMCVLETDDSEVERVIINLKSSSVAGVDGISGHILKLTRKMLIPYITHICNLAISTGVFPDCFKIALVHPIHKGGDRGSVKNYRPISILPTISKILEKILNNRLLKYINTHKLLSENQYGFRAGIATEDAVIAFSEKVTQLMDKKQRCIGLFLDISKAFDTVSAPILLSKLERMGIRGPALDIFSSYLENRFQHVQLDAVTSDKARIEYGVPQGSILGPTLFLIYINDLCSIPLTNCFIFTYADDTALLVHGNDWSETEKYAQMMLDIVMNWFSNNLLTLNAEKTKLISFSLSNRTQPHISPIVKAHSCSPYTSCACPTLATTSCVKYLGVQIDKHLNWYRHIDNLVIRTRKLISIFKKLRCSADSETLMMAYFSLCQSLLLYCLPAWGGACKTYFLKLERAQRAVLKVMFCKPYKYPTLELFRESKVLTVRGLYVLQCVLRKHRLPFTESTKRRVDIVLPPVRHKTTFAKHQFSYLSCILYNKINKSLHIHSLNYHNYKNIVKKWLIEKSYDETENLLFPHA